MLLFDNFSDNTLTLREQYEQQRKAYENGAYWIVLNLNKVLGPYPKNDEIPWDVSLYEQYASCGAMKDLLKWINVKIVLQLGKIDKNNDTLKTYDVLLRVATGMLNKIPIPKEYKLMFHGNLIRNVHDELNKIVLEDLPF